MNPTDLRKDQSAVSDHSCDAACPNILQQQQKMAKLCILMIITEIFLLLKVKMCHGDEHSAAWHQLKLS